MSKTALRKNLLYGFLYAFITIVIWAGNYVVAKGISKEIPPISIAFFRWSIASVVIFPIGLGSFMKDKKMVFQHKWYFLITAIFGVSLFNTFIYLAGHYTSAINLALIGATASPIFISILSYFIFKDKISGLRIFGLLLCISGILILLSKGNWQQFIGLQFGKGDLLMLCSAFAFSIYSILVRKKPDGISPKTLLFVIFILGSIILLPFTAWELGHSETIHWNATLISILFYLGIGNSVIGFFCWNIAISKIGPARTALFGTLIPMISSLEAVVFLGENFSSVHIFSGIILITGLILANLKLD